MADGTYRDLEQTFEAPSPREAAQRAFDQLDLHPDEEFPELLVVPDEEVHVFTRDDHGRSVITIADMAPGLTMGPATSSVTFRVDETEALESRLARRAD